MNETPTEILAALRRAMNVVIQAADDQLRRQELTISRISVGRTDVTTRTVAAGGGKQFVMGSIDIDIAITRELS